MSNEEHKSESLIEKIYGHHDDDKNKGESSSFSPFDSDDEIMISAIKSKALVSDREFRATLPETDGMIDLASKLTSEGRGSELMSRDANQDSPITTYRFHFLCAYMGDDYMFSSNLSDNQLKQRLGHMCNKPCQVLYSMGEEYVPNYVDKKALVERHTGGILAVEITIAMDTILL